MAHQKAGASSRNGPRLQPVVVLAVKKYGGELSHSRQHPGAPRGTKVLAGSEALAWQDSHDLCLSVDGKVQFHKG